MSWQRAHTRLGPQGLSSAPPYPCSRRSCGIRYFASGPSASSALKVPVPVRAEDGLDPLQSIVADAADGTDGVMQLVLAYGRYPNCARSEPPLAAEYNLNPKRAEEGLCPP